MRVHVKGPFNPLLEAFLADVFEPEIGTDEAKEADSLMRVASPNLDQEEGFFFVDDEYELLEPNPSAGLIKEFEELTFASDADEPGRRVEVRRDCAGNYLFSFTGYQKEEVENSLAIMRAKLQAKTKITSEDLAAKTGMILTPGEIYEKAGFWPKNGYEAASVVGGIDEDEVALQLRSELVDGEDKANQLTNQIAQQLTDQIQHCLGVYRLDDAERDELFHVIFPQLGFSETNSQGASHLGKTKETHYALRVVIENMATFRLNIFAFLRAKDIDSLLVNEIIEKLELKPNFYLDADLTDDILKRTCEQSELFLKEAFLVPNFGEETTNFIANLYLAAGEVEEKNKQKPVDLVAIDLSGSTFSQLTITNEMGQTKKTTIAKMEIEAFRAAVNQLKQERRSGSLDLIAYGTEAQQISLSLKDLSGKDYLLPYYLDPEHPGCIRYGQLPGQQEHDHDYEILDLLVVALEKFVNRLPEHGLGWTSYGAVIEYLVSKGFFTRLLNITDGATNWETKKEFKIILDIMNGQLGKGRLSHLKHDSKLAEKMRRDAYEQTVWPHFAKELPKDRILIAGLMIGQAADGEAAMLLRSLRDGVGSNESPGIVCAALHDDLNIRLTALMSELNNAFDKKHKQHEKCYQAKITYLTANGETEQCHLGFIIKSYSPTRVQATLPKGCQAESIDIYHEGHLVTQHHITGPLPETFTPEYQAKMKKQEMDAFFNPFKSQLVKSQLDEQPESLFVLFAFMKKFKALLGKFAQIVDPDVARCMTDLLSHDELATMNKVHEQQKQERLEEEKVEVETVEKKTGVQNTKNRKKYRTRRGVVIQGRIKSSEEEIQIQWQLAERNLSEKLGDSSGMEEEKSHSEPIPLLPLLQLLRQRSIDDYHVHQLGMNTDTFNMLKNKVIALVEADKENLSYQDICYLCAFSALIKENDPLNQWLERIFENKKINGVVPREPVQPEMGERSVPEEQFAAEGFFAAVTDNLKTGKDNSAMSAMEIEPSDSDKAPLLPPKLSMIPDHHRRVVHRRRSQPR